jgi:hypothetical protein
VVIAVAAITFIKFIIAPFGATLTFDDTSGGRSGKGGECPLEIADHK